MKKMVKRTAVVTLAGVMSVGMLSGCGSKTLDGTKTVATVDGTDIPLGVVSLYARDGLNAFGSLIDTNSAINKHTAIFIMSILGRIKHSWHETMAFFSASITYIWRLFKLFTFRRFICRTYIYTTHILLFTDFTHSSTLLITETGHFTFFSMNAGRIGITWIRTLFDTCMKTYFLRYC